MRSVRERVRAEMIDEIKASARRQLAVEGANLSLRAISRDLGMVSSAIYRYFPSRDDLLTALIIDGYTTLADLVATAENAVPRDDLAGRFSAAGHTIRDWGREHRAEYALLYGSPVPGYVAPPETAVPVVRLSLVLIDILRDGVATGVLTSVPAERVDPVLAAELDTMLDRLGRSVPAPIMARGFTAWAGLIGVISFELFGHSVGITQDYDLLFANEVAQLNRLVGVA